MGIFTEEPRAPLYDARTRDAAVGADGVLRTCHVVDHKMQMGLVTRRGSWKSSPKIGNDLWNIQYIGGPTTQADVERCVRSAEPCATLIADGEAEIRSISYEVTTYGGLKVSVDYVNLKQDRNRVQRITTVI